MKKECRICLGDHNQEIHDATRRVREWLRSRLLVGPVKAGPKGTHMTWASYGK